jgi:bacteriocin biosynthesis cyclodehydratase domain-containing protein
VPVDLGDGRVQLRSAHNVLTLGEDLLARVYLDLYQQIDGSAGVDDLSRRGGPDTLPSTVVFLLKVLRANGFLEDATPPPLLEPRDITDYEQPLRVLGQIGSEPLAVLAQLRSARVLITGRGPLAAVVSRALEDCAITARPVVATEPCDLLIGCFGGGDGSTARALNAECVAAGVRWLPVVVDGPTACLGPAVIPHQTACLECLEARRASTRRVPAEWLLYRARVDAWDGADSGMLAPLVQTVASQAALEAVRLLTSAAPPATVGAVIDYTIESPLAERQTVLKAPRCRVCGRRGPAPEPWDVKLAEPAPLA